MRSLRATGSQKEQVNPSVLVGVYPQPCPAEFVVDCSVQLWWLLDVASNEPEWSKERADEVEETSPRQLGGIGSGVSVGYALAVEANRKCLSRVSQVRLGGMR